ncbi:hypothetical protein QJQ45_019693 [Haematococcus lacustris]|nr:hypothetical protein QJQ45_019693 [Haematococcus lacustris]
MGARCASVSRARLHTQVSAPACANFHAKASHRTTRVPASSSENTPYLRGDGQPEASRRRSPSPPPIAPRLRNSAPSVDWATFVTRWLLHFFTKTLPAFLVDSWHVLFKLSAPSLPDAVKRLALTLVVSGVMMVAVTTIDSTFLWLYVLNARKLAPAV